MNATARWSRLNARGGRGAWLALGLLALGVTACDETTGPDDSARFDARKTADDYATVQHILETADWGDLAVVAKGAALAAPGGAGTARVAGAPIISGFHRGATFVYDADAADWVVDSTREGAPANGVRFILYERVGGTPDPTRERGWADLIDEGEGSAEDVALRLRVMEQGTMTMDYGLRADEEAGRGTIAAEGFVIGDGQRLDFDVDVEGGAGDANHLVFDLAVDGRDFSAQGEAIGSDDSDDGEIHLAARHSAHRLDLDAVSSAGTMEGRIDLDAEPFVRIGGSSDEPIFTRPDGSPVGSVEVLALLQVVEFSDDVFDLVEEILEPVGGLILLGWIL